MAVNYASQYQQALQQVFKVGLKFGALYNTSNNNLVKWINAKTIQVPSITTGGFRDVNRDSVSGYTRRVDNSWETYTLEHDREFSTLVDPMDIDESNMALTIANITQVFNTEHKIPEMDKYAASKLYAEYLEHGGEVDRDALTVNNILSKFDKYMADMDDLEVPEDGRIMYVTSETATLLKDADKISRSINVQGGGEKDVDRRIRSLDSVTIVTVPSSRMKTAYNFTDGAVPDAAAEQIDMIIVHPAVLYTPQKYEFVSLDNPSAKTAGKYLYYERKYWDLFVIATKVDGVKIHVKPTEDPGTGA